MDDNELRRLPLLSELDEQQIGHMRDTRRTFSFAAGETLFHMGDQCGNFYYLDSGTVKLFRISPSGQEKIVEIIRPGQTFAEAVMFFAQPLYPVNAEALEDTMLTAFDSATFMSMLRESTDTCIRLLGTLSMRLHHRLNEIDALSLQNSMLRVVNYLLRRLEDSASSEAAVELEASKKVIAARLSIQPETFSRVLHALTDSGAIAVDGRTIRITSEQTLRHFTGAV
jgi:CRP-like cAMP-binding protein